MGISSSPASPSNTSASTDQLRSGPRKSRISVIVGPTVAGVVVIATILAAAIVFRREKRKSRSRFWRKHSTAYRSHHFKAMPERSDDTAHPPLFHVQPFPLANSVRGGEICPQEASDNCSVRSTASQSEVNLTTVQRNLITDDFLRRIWERPDN